LGQSLKPLSSVFASQEAKKQDSLRRLIRELDLGPYSRGGAGAKAYNALRSLGSLMVPSLLAELDGMGPFGLMNASKLLASYPDESLGGLVERYLEDPSPARQEMAAGLLSKLAPESRRKLYPLALASKRDKVRLDGLYAMIGLGSSGEAVMAEIRRIYKEGRTPTRSSLVYLLGQHELLAKPSGRDLLRAAMLDPDRGLRESAFRVYVGHAKDEDEPKAMALMVKMDKYDRESFAELVMEAKRKWPGVLMMGLEFEDVRQQVPGFLNRMGIRLSAPQIESLIVSKDTNLVRLGLERLRVRKELVPEMKPLLALMDHPDSYVRQTATNLLSENGPLLVLEGGRLSKLRQGSRFGGPIAVLEKAHSGHWSKEMLTLWEEIEQVERENPGLNVTGDKINLGRLMARKLTAADWPLVEHFLRQAWLDPRVAISIRSSHYYSRRNAAAALLNAGYLDRDLQPKALLLTSVTTEKIAMLIFDQVSESLVDGEARPRIEGALFQLIADASSNKRDSSQVQKRNAYPRGELLESSFSLLEQLPGSDRDAELLGFIKSPERQVASGASRALLSRTKDRNAVYAAILASPHAESLINRQLGDPLLAQDEKLRETIVVLLSKSLLKTVRHDQLEAFLRNLAPDERRTVLNSLLGKGAKGVSSNNKMVLLKVLGDFKDPSYLSIYEYYLADPQDPVRGEAIMSIGRTFSPKAAPLLLEALKDDFEDNSTMAKSYLMRIDEYLQEKAKWTERFGVRKPTTPGPSGPTHPKK
jgi:HEAT repeats